MIGAGRLGAKTSRMGVPWRHFRGLRTGIRQDGRTLGYPVDGGRYCPAEWPRPHEEAKEASETVLEGEMPPAPYTLLHAHARLNAAERDRLVRGLARTLGIAPEQEAHERDR